MENRDSTAASPQALLAHTEWVRRLARALVRSDDTDDVVQQTYVQALAHPTPSRNLRGWLGAIARNVVRRSARDASMRTRHEPRLPQPAHAPDPVEAVARAELHRRVVDAVLALDEPYRSTLVLRFFEEQPVEAIARAAGVPVETVRTRVKRGLARLRERLGGEFAREGASLSDGLALLLVPSGGGGGGGAGTIGGAGALVMKYLVATSVAVVVVAAAWRAVAPHGGLPEPVPAPMHAAAAPASKALAPTHLAEATRESTELPDPSPPAPADTPSEVGAVFDFEGRVVDAKGGAVADALVLLGDTKRSWARPEDTQNDDVCGLADGLLSGQADLERLGARGTRSAADGGFRFGKVDADRAFTLVALHETAGVGRAPAPTRAAKAPVVVTLAAMIVVRGRVTEADGRVSAGVKLEVHASIDAQLGTGGGCRIAADGTFRHFWSRLESVTFVARSADGRESESRLDFGPADPRVRKIELVLPASGAGPCHGRIVDKSGAPLDLRGLLLSRLAEWERVNGGARSVRLFALRGDDAPPAAFETGIGAVVESGTIDLDAATYDVVLPTSARWIALVARERTLGAVAVTPAKAAAGGPDLVVDLSQLPSGPTRAALEVRLIDAKTGTPYSGPPAEVRLESHFEDGTQPGVANMSSTPPARRDDSAGIVWFDQVRPSRCTVTVEIAGMAAIRRKLDVVARAEPYRVEITVRNADASLRGTVVDPDGKPLARAHVRILLRTATGLDAENTLPTLTNGEGRFVFEGLATGEGLVIVHALPFAPAILPVKFANEQDAGPIALAAGGRVAVTVVRARGDADHSSFESLHVVRTEDGLPLADPLWEGSVDWKTGTRLELALPPGRATLDLSLIDGTKVRRELDVVDGKTLDVQIE